MALKSEAMSWGYCKRSLHYLSSKLTFSLDRRHPISTYGYTQAKALVYSRNGPPKEVLSIHTHSISPPHSNLITLRTLNSPLNPADINQIEGSYPSQPPFASTLGTPQPAAVPGNEGVFEVLSTGSGVKGLAKGDWVLPKRTGIGAWRTHLQVGEDLVTKIENREGLSALQCATVTINPVTAYRMLKDTTELTPSSESRGGDWFVQNGANSGVGRAALQFAKLWGIKNIAIVRKRPDPDAARLEAELKSLGATIVTTEDDIQQKGFSDQVKEWTNGGREKIKLGLNCVGGSPATAMAKMLSSGAHMVTYGAMSKRPLSIPAGFLIFKNITFTGFWVTKWGDTHPEKKRRTVEEILDLMRAGKFKDVPTSKIEWNWDTEAKTLVDEVAKTLEGNRSGKGVFVFGDT